MRNHFHLQINILEGQSFTSGVSEVSNNAVLEPSVHPGYIDTQIANFQFKLNFKRVGWKNFFVIETLR